MPWEIDDLTLREVAAFRSFTDAYMQLMTEVK
jgi:hypothetical protein